MSQNVFFSEEEHVYSMGYMYHYFFPDEKVIKKSWMDKASSRSAKSMNLSEWRASLNSIYSIDSAFTLTIRANTMTD